MVANSPVTAEWIDALLQLPALEQQLALLRSAHLLHAEGLSQLLDEGMQRARSDPGQARQLAVICAEVAEEANAPAIVPRTMKASPAVGSTVSPSVTRCCSASRMRLP